MENESYSLTVKTGQYDVVNDMAIIAAMSKMYDGKVDCNLVDKILSDIELDRDPILYVGCMDKCKIGGKILSECKIYFEIDKI